MIPGDMASILCQNALDLFYISYEWLLSCKFSVLLLLGFYVKIIIPFSEHRDLIESPVFSW